MANAKKGSKRNSPLDFNNLSQRDHDILILETKEVMKKYKVEKQSVYDRRFALNKKLKEAGLTVEQVLNKTSIAEPAKIEKQPKKTQTRKVKAEKTETPSEEKVSDSREVMVVNKQVPVIMKPIEINFDNFSIKLNGVPKKISVNPDTHAIEIDL